MIRAAEPLFRPASVAIVGASERGGAGWTRSLFENLEAAGFPVPVYLVNPRIRELWGRPVYPDFASLPGPVDLALTVIPAPAVPAVLEEGARHGLRCALVFAARFGEGGDGEGAARARALERLRAGHGLRICGPNCMGALAIRERLLFYPTARVRGLPAGPAGVVFQSGGTFQYWLQQAAARGLGFSYAVSSGNELDLDLADYVDFLVADEATRLVVCLVEGIGRPAAFMAAAERALAAGKPILVLKVGASPGGRAATLSHTGALAGDHAVFEAVCRKYGIILCPSLDDLIEASLAFQAGRIPTGPRVAMAGYSGGAKGLFLDYAAERALPLAELGPATREALAPLLDPGLEPDNPLDTGAGVAGRPDRFSQICRIIARDPGVDLLSMQGQLPLAAGEGPGPEVFTAVAEVGKPVVAHGRMGQNVTEAGRALQAAAGVPFLQGLPETVRVLEALGGYGLRRRRPPEPLPHPDPRARPLDQEGLRARLAAHGLPGPAQAIASTPRAAAEAAGAIGFPVVLKAVSPQPLHKTEIGAVALNLADAAAVRRAAESMRERLAARRPAVDLSGFLVQEQIEGLELILGVREDPQFGPVAIVGLGGVYVEVLADVALRLLPVGVADAREMLDSLRARPLLGPFRGRPARDVDAVVDALCGLSAFYLAHRRVLADLEVNPLIVLDAGVRAVDLRAIWR